MATYDLTDRNDNSFTKTSTISALPSMQNRQGQVLILEKVIDIEKMIANGYTFAAGDVLQAMQIPGESFVFFGGAEVIEAFDGTTPTVDIDFAGGDDIVDGGDVSTAGWLAAGTNGQTMSVTTGAASTFVQHVASDDTIDVTLNAGAADVTKGVLRLVACVVRTAETGRVLPSEVDRNRLA